MPSIPVSTIERAKLHAALREDFTTEVQGRLGPVQARMFGIQRTIEDLPINGLAGQAKALADIVLQLEALRNELPALVVGTQVG